MWCENYLLYPKCPNTNNNNYHNNIIANEHSFRQCVACGHPSRFARLSTLSAGRHRTSQSMANLFSGNSTDALTPTTPTSTTTTTTTTSSSASAAEEIHRSSSRYHCCPSSVALFFHDLPPFISTVENFRLRTATLLRNSSPVGVGNRITLLSKVSNMFVEASAMHGIDQPLCKDCFRRTDRKLHSQIATLKTQAARFDLVVVVWRLFVCIYPLFKISFHSL
jgi:hypothetical protein